MRISFCFELFFPHAREFLDAFLVRWTIMENIRVLLTFIADSLFPRRCIGCGAQGESACIRCLSSVPIASKNGTVDADIISVFDYRDPVMRKAIWCLKYQRNRTIAKNLGRMLYEYLIDDLGERETLSHFIEPILMPIPSAKKRVRARGFNQAELLARAITAHDKENHLELLTDAIIKIRNTIPQARIRNRGERLRNLRGAFAVTKPERIRRRNIILIDDVATTGATIAEAKKVLKKAGAKKVIGLTVAH
jgi:ComF family protein